MQIPIKTPLEKSDFITKVLKTLVGVGISIALVGTGFMLNFAVRPTEEGTTVVEVSASIELAETQVPATIETAEGEVEIVELPTVEAVDSGNITGLTKCSETEEECGLGTYIYAPVETITAFKDYVLGKCWNTDEFAGGQCWDLGDLFWQNYAGRRLSTCGTGAAKGTFEGDCKYVNAGEEFELITDPAAIRAGDWVVFNNGTWGHIGQALAKPNGNYVSLLGQNQGSTPCEGGGSAANIINISLKNFSGAFRPKAYIIPEPLPEPEELPDTSH